MVSNVHHSGHRHGAGMSIRFWIKNVGSGAGLSGSILQLHYVLVELDSTKVAPDEVMASGTPAFV